MFNHAIGYARVTKYLAYEHVGHVKERPLKGFKGPKHLHINERMFIGKSLSSFDPCFSFVYRPSYICKKGISRETLNTNINE
jgi:hypothetical protein